MLNFVYWPISAILWFWHWLLSLVLNPAWGITWILSIVLLTWTIKAIMVKPTINQLRSSRKMQEIQPKLQEIRTKYANDQMKASQEMQKIYKESGVRPIAGCLPMLAQMPVFIGLFHVLRSFDRTVSVAGGIGHPAGDPMSIEANANTANYIFSPELVQQFLDAKIFGIPLVANLRVNSPILQDVTSTQAAFIIVPLIAVIAVLTHFNARMTLSRQEARRAAGKTVAPQGQNAEMMQQQMAMMNKMMLWFMPAMLVFSGFIWPIGLLFYMLSNTVWTFFQTRLVFAKMDREEEAEEAAKVELKRTTAPKPGARKKDARTKKQRKKNN
ncbi:membrane protein insertase YidC [Corynebacterium flavescens]|uniref:membrane protein insertase YidC n=1 Tax=Corynebacterium flavescens TaxID=28028 RepID=UPI002647AA3F|nr:membrane protein insertase YidC [Corynebacterium flavescens]MDN6431815.1 membrane protein insertase YidC [Corynebacterium flavescens]MDN6475633.1 membrane protein insertase YidC [Corynebacterium flavescens]MDN6531881.1 membrane protein insertase YidC [Corynebacterium flavescens]MDN6601716.1 membrane protein insertase YidC [Corynebacterium flavescens]MDN6646558.1 membrane protein insertase YidC [Corynebacterium flavescens]